MTDDRQSEKERRHYGKESGLQGPTVRVWKRRVSAAEKQRNTRGFEGIYVKGKENRRRDLTHCCNIINDLAYSQ